MPRTLARVTLALLALAGLAPPAPAQIVVVTAHPVNDLLADAEYVARLLKQEKEFRKFQTELERPDARKMLDGLDRKRPFGAYLQEPFKAADLNAFDLPVVAFVPVANETAVLDMLYKLCDGPFGYDGTLYHFLAPGGVRFYLRFAHGYAYVSPREALLRAAPPEPKTLLPADAGPLLTVTLHVERLPREFLQLPDELVAEIEAGMKEWAGDGRKQPGESDADYRQRLAAIRSFRDLFKGIQTGWPLFLAQVRTVSVALSLDRRQHQLALELALVPKRDTGLASAAAFVGKARSRFGPLARQADVGLALHVPAIESLRDALPGELKQVPAATVGEMVPARYRDAVAKLFQVAFQTLVTDGIDFGLLIRMDKDLEDFNVVVAGLKVQGGRQLDYLLRDTYKNAAPADKSHVAFEWNHARYAGARIHQMKMGGEEFLGFLAFRDDVLFGGLGKDSLPYLRQTLDGLPKTSPGPSPLLEIHVSGRLLNENKPLSEEVKKQFPGLKPEQVHATVSLRGGTDFRLRAQAHTAVLSLLAAAVLEPVGRDGPFTRR
jgi:hypothetical protein